MFYLGIFSLVSVWKMSGRDNSEVSYLFSRNLFPGGRGQNFSKKFSKFKGTNLLGHYFIQGLQNEKKIGITQKIQLKGVFFVRTPCTTISLFNSFSDKKLPMSIPWNECRCSLFIYFFCFNNSWWMVIAHLSFIGLQQNRLYIIRRGWSISSQWEHHCY